MADVESPAIPYTPAMLARLVHAHTAYEMSERLVSEVSTYADSFGRGAFLTEQSASVLTGARLLLEEAVIADRLRGASWSDVAEALGTSEDEARDEFSVWEREFRDALLFPCRHGENGRPGRTVAPYAAEEPDRMRLQLDAWVVERRRSSGPDRDEPEPVTRGLVAMSATWIVERMSQVLALTDALIKRSLPTGVSYEQARRRHAEMKVELYEAMVAQRPGHRDVELQLIEAREQLSELTA
jgi:hypothetical protein